MTTQNTTNQTTTTTTANAFHFFDLHLRGLGYVNRVREVQPKKGNPYYSCSISALRGTSDKPDYTYLDCNVVGETAIKLIKRCMDACEAKKKILISFIIGDINPELFVYQNGNKKGETGVSLKGRLLNIRTIKIDGELVYSDVTKIDDATQPNEPHDDADEEHDVNQAAPSDNSHDGINQ